MSVPVDPGVDMKLLHSIRFVSYFDVIAAALYIWDYLITFDMEVDLVWRSKWNTMKVLFLVQRYLPFADTVFLVLFQKVGRNLSISDCQQVYQALGCPFILKQTREESADLRCRDDAIGDSVMRNTSRSTSMGRLEPRAPRNYHLVHDLYRIMGS
ncbi:hypothetical protein JR316_0011328 [Psilocybe cubensis]|uniref:Uncharacterized protein n=2 Tax=Psilocybe cubensis TaxID=181762 RepID=A0ACB8GJU0_PSICU|nr:hypothetical protein JR316_0011328 [Psilocybe cubensis]KAH9475769.1 hypothetical protein JR316_0011328 [Psilocybe cubensis]